jgi:ligand-binding SRPBCC domain-containing protein
MGRFFHTLRREQWIPRPINEVFTFFADTRNLEEITPPWLNFKILSVDSTRMKSGTGLLYHIRWHGIPIRWYTKIRKWDEPHRFIDVQMSGPYKLWHHTHSFESHGNQTRMIDVVRYALPLGIIGNLLHSIKVGRDVHRIFDYRRERIHELFAKQRSIYH